MATLYMSPISTIIQYLNNIGVLAAGGQIFTYVGGSVSTLLTTYTDSTGTTANPNPLTLSAAARPVSASGAPIAFWHASGQTCTLVVQDNVGNTLFTLPSVPAINDPSGTNSLQTQLASPAQFSGVDLVANAMKSYAVVANVQASQPPVLASNQTLIIATQGQATIGDGLGGLYYWAASSSATDDNGVTTIAPTGGGVGRYIRWSGSSTSSFTATITSGANTATGTLKYRLAAGLVHLWSDAGLLVNSAAATLTISGLPAGISPSSPRAVLCGKLENASGVEYFGEAIVGTAGTMTMQLGVVLSTTNIGIGGGGNSWSTSGTNGLTAAWSINYGL